MTPFIKKVLPTTTFIVLLIVGVITTIHFTTSLTSTDTSALTFSSSTNVSFTFAPKLSISLSDTSLAIDNIVPGQTATSNPITITVSSNTPYGYSLYADAGSNNAESTYYNTSSLVHSDSTVNNTFTSIATNASLTQLTTDNTWGYSTSSDNGATWSVYNGLPTATSTSGNTSTSNPALLIDTKDPADSSKSIDFKVAARSSTTQASGSYGNVINFYAVGKPRPLYMQDTEYIKSKLENIGDELQAMDIRDGKEYWVAKLADGNIWMTQNLDLDLDSARTYTPADTDVPGDWVPERSTTTSTAWDISNTGKGSPHSYDPGNLYWNGIVTIDTSATISDNTVAEPSATPGGTHYSIGNYYNWTAATASDGSISAVGRKDINQSICPAGWRLPTYIGGKSFVNLKNVQGLTSGTDGYIQLAPTYFIYGGFWNGTSKYVGNRGYYWTSEFNNDLGGAYLLYFEADGYLNPWAFSKNVNGSTLRCVMR